MSGCLLPQQEQPYDKRGLGRRVKVGRATLTLIAIYLVGCCEHGCQFLGLANLKGRGGESIFSRRTSGGEVRGRNSGEVTIALVI